MLLTLDFLNAPNLTRNFLKAISFQLPGTNFSNDTYYMTCKVFYLLEKYV